LGALMMSKSEFELKRSKNGTNVVNIGAAAEHGTNYYTKIPQKRAEHPRLGIIVPVIRVAMPVKQDGGITVPHEKKQGRCSTT
ncbi:hypothetical protein TorRG33x02_005260, partial [Trema orientale]